MSIDNNSAHYKDELSKNYNCINNACNFPTKAKKKLKITILFISIKNSSL